MGAGLKRVWAERDPSLIRRWGWNGCRPIISGTNTWGEKWVVQKMAGFKDAQSS